jgi:putative transposase
MNRSCNCWDNAAIESFFSLRKTERTAYKIYRARNEAGTDLFDYVECFYSLNWRHSTIRYMSPMGFKAKAGLA